MELTPSNGPFKVGEVRAKGSKEGKGATKGRQRQTDRDKKKEVLWCLVYIPQPSCLKHSKICNLYNHPVQMSASNPLSQKQDRSPCRWCHQVPTEADGARWQVRTKQILQIMCWSQWHTGSWMAPQEMTKGKIKHLHGLQRGGQLDGKRKTFLGQIYHKMKSRCLSVELEERVKNTFLPFLLTRTLTAIMWAFIGRDVQKDKWFPQLYQFHNIVCLVTSSLHILLMDYLHLRSI